MDEIYSLAKELLGLQKTRLSMIKPRVKKALENNIGSNDIEHLLDELLDLYSFFGNKDVEDMFMLLCDKLMGIDEEAAKDYISFLEEEKHEKSL